MTKLRATTQDKTRVSKKRKVESDDDTPQETTPNKSQKSAKSDSKAESTGFPQSTSDYRSRIISQKKELFKDPPSMPPTSEVLPTRQSAPKRRPDGEFVFADHPNFRPNLSPKEVLQSGAFGGTYFRPIVSAVTGEKLKNVHKEFPNDWFEGLDMAKQVTSSTYDANVNKYKVKCGGSLGMWESSGWISEIDPYGWFQWYCRFFEGRRSTDDKRQIDRWAKGHGPKGRWRSQLMNKIIKANTTYDDTNISPVVRQVGLHWAFELKQCHLEAHAKAKGLQLMKKEDDDSE